MAELETRLLIGGEQVAGDGDPLEVENPATEEIVATVGRLAASRSRPRSPPPTRPSADGSGRPAVERGEMLHEVAASLRAAPMSSRRS